MLLHTLEEQINLFNTGHKIVL